MQACCDVLAYSMRVSAPVQTAVNNMTNELMLLGVATLLLAALQNDIEKICSAYPLLL